MKQFFFYLTSFLDSYKVSDIVHELEEYIDGWIQDSFRYVDSIGSETSNYTV